MVEMGANARETAARIAGNWQAAILWEPGHAADACKRAGIARRIGPAEKALKKLLTHPVEPDPPGPVKHRVTFYLSIVSRLGMPVNLPELFLPVMEPEPMASTVVLSPDSEFGPRHEWPVARWREIADKFVAEKWKITVAGLAGGRNLGRKLADDIGADVRFFEAHPLGGAMALLGTHALVVAADGFLPHLAAMSGATCVTLFGGNDPVWKRPLGKRHSHIWRHAGCVPCVDAKCPLGGRCQCDHSVETVWPAIQKKFTSVP